MLYDNQFIARAMKGDYSGTSEVKLNIYQRLLVYIVKICMIIMYGIIFIICHIPLLSSFYETLARTYSRGALGFFLRGAYYKTKLKKMGNNVFIDVGVTIWTPGNVEIGDNSHIDTYVTILGGEKGHGGIQIGKCVHVASNAVLGGRGGIKIGDYAAIGAGCKIYSGSNYYGSKPNKDIGQISMSAAAPLNMQVIIEKTVYIEDYAFLGANSTVLPGVTIGRAAVIGACSMVPNDIPAGSIAFVVPAKVLKQRPDLV